jgi:NAD dependent epimerase/dehydratase family enzyme
MSWVHMRDVVRALLFAIDREVLSGPFNLCAPAPVTMNDFARALGAAMHRPSIFRVPTFALRLAVGDGLARVLLTGQRALPNKLQACGFTFDFPSLDAALADLVHEPARAATIANA